MSPQRHTERDVSFAFHVCSASQQSSQSTTPNKHVNLSVHSSVNEAGPACGDLENALASESQIEELPAEHNRLDIPSN